MLMRHEVNGWHNASGLEVEEMKKNGWIEVTEAEHLAIIAAKRKAKDEPLKEVSVIIEPQQEAVKGKPGRKPKHF